MKSDFSDPHEDPLSRASLSYFKFFLDISYPELNEEDRADNDLMSYIFDRFYEDHLIALMALEKGVEITDDQVNNFIQLELTHMTFKLQTPEIQRFYRHEIRKRLLIRDFLKNKIKGNIEVTEEEAQDYFSEHTNDFVIEPKFCIRQIQFEDKEKAVDFKKLVDSGQKTFKEAAEEIEEIGFVHELAPCLALSSFPERFQKTIQHLRQGATSSVLELDYGEKTIYHVLMLERKIQAVEYSFEEIFPKIVSVLEKEKIEKKLEMEKKAFLSNYKLEMLTGRLPFKYISVENRRSEP